jgi:hypothetical protein
MLKSDIVPKFSFLYLDSSYLLVSILFGSAMFHKAFKWLDSHIHTMSVISLGEVIFNKLRYFDISDMSIMSITILCIRRFHVLVKGTGEVHHSGRAVCRIECVRPLEYWDPGFDLTRGMVYLQFFPKLFFYVGGGIATCWSPSKHSYHLHILRKWNK